VLAIDRQKRLCLLHQHSVQPQAYLCGLLADRVPPCHLMLEVFRPELRGFRGY
jgi:hypothetical protein